MVVKAVLGELHWTNESFAAINQLTQSAEKMSNTETKQL